MAALNRAEFARRRLLVLNIVSSPGSGKTAFLERTLRDIAGEIPMAVIVGDLATDNDAKRLDGKGARVLQVTTDGYCHLEANMIAAACDQIGLEGLRLLIIENVGNLVCPSSHDLGEDLRVVLLSVTEGEDKPLKYPVVFKSADVAVVSKMDLAEAVEFKREDALANIHAVAPDSKVFEVSSKSGLGMDAWYDFLRANLKQS
jgi:hydrogenase nickel incorporation protein HypB